MSKYVVYLEEGAKVQVLLKTDDFQEADDFLYQKWHEIEGKQVLRLIGDGGLQCIRHALKGNPLSEWEEKRLNELRKMEKDIERHGDMTLIVRGLVVPFEENNQKYVRIA